MIKQQHHRLTVYESPEEARARGIALATQMLLYVCTRCGLRYQAAGPEHVRRCICGGELKHG